jgi:ABC-2 type transport system ATP-binding protein
MIQVNNLSKSFDEIQAVDDISFNIEKGEIFGLLGPNGAGKSTTINMLSTILQSDSGTIFIDDIAIKTDPKACKKLIGVVPQEISLYEELSAYDNLLFWGNLYGIPSHELKENINTILELIGLSDRKKDLIKTYSGGMKRRINIAAAILHQPKILFMDEPTVGIDPQSRNHIFEVIETLNAQGMTIIYTTHYMEEVERLCNRIAIIGSGSIIAQGTQTELQQIANVKETIELTFESLSQKEVQKFQEKTDYEVVQIDTKMHITSTIKNIPAIITVCNELKLDVQDLNIKKANLEAIFLSLTGKQLRD